jgi:uncharacterized protein
MKPNPPAREEVVQFRCGADELVGVLHTPIIPAETAVVVVVGGPQYRVGSHRQFVQLARAVVAGGYAVLRFDYRGMGDSGGERRSFEQVSDDIGAAIDLLQQRLPSVREVVLWGLCDGASAALLYCDEKNDRRVTGVCAFNPWVRSETSLAKTQLKHYYGRRLLQREFWLKLLRGELGMSAFGELLQKIATARRKAFRASHRDATFQERMVRGWCQVGGRVLLVLSCNDYTAKEFSEYTASDADWRAALAQPAVMRLEMTGADHTFSQGEFSAAVERITLDWLRTMGASGPAAARQARADVLARAVG